MKKILLPLMLAVAIVIPAAQVQAADVPGFRQFGGNYLTFAGGQQLHKDGYRTYVYNFDIDLNEDFAERYVRELVNRYNFRQIGHVVHDFRRSSASLYESWFFVYTGSKRVSKFEYINLEDLKNPYYCHVVVSKGKKWAEEEAYFSIGVAYGLTYGED